MKTERKAELAQMCAVQIRQATVIAKSLMSDYGYHFVQSVFDAEFQAMLDRLEDKPFTEHDVPVLMDLLMDDLWPRLRDQHRQHRDYVFDAIKKMNRETISVDAAFAFDIGWRRLLQSAADRVETYPSAWKARLVGGKEKLGCCIIHIDYDGCQLGARGEVERLREEIRLRSLATCDICGENGRLRLSSIAKTICDKHSAVLGEMRDDDGVHADPYRWRDEQPIEDHIAEVIATGRAVMSASDGEIADVQTGLDELKLWREEAESLRQHLVVVGHMLEEYKHRHRPKTAIFRQIERDIESNHGRKAELIIRFVGQIETAVVAAMSVAGDDVDFWLRTEVDRWQCVQPVSDDDREFLHGYLRELIDTEYERVKAKAAERNKD